MNSPLVFIANEPRAYRETIATALGMLRPEAEVVVVEPEALETAIACQQPDVAFCSQITPAVKTVATWVLLYPDGANSAVINVRGAESTTSELSLLDLAQVIGAS